MPAYVRSFPYFTTPVYGYFMQQRDKKWNLRITKDTNLTDFSSDFFEANPLEINDEHIRKIGSNYGIDSIIERETEREEKRTEIINEYKRIFLGDSVVQLELENMNIGFNPSNLVPLDSFGTVYPNLRITDNWGILEVDSGGALLSPEWNKVTISYPESISDSLISGNGWRLKLNHSWKLEKIDDRYTLTKE